MDLFDELRALIVSLREHEIEYAVVGALAVAVYGAPRATTDIDILVREEDLVRLAPLVRGLGFDLEALPMTFESGVEVRRFTKLAARDALTLDLLLAKGPLSAAFAQREDRETDFGAVTVITLDALIAMKTLAGRPRDLDDIRRLRELDG